MELGIGMTNTNNDTLNQTILRKMDSTLKSIEHALEHNFTTHASHQVERLQNYLDWLKGLNEL